MEMPILKWGLIILIPLLCLLLNKLILPDVLIGGGEGGNPINGLLGLQLLEQLRKKAKEE